jgi:outer membrane protein assembly factor BamB
LLLAVPFAACGKPTPSRPDAAPVLEPKPRVETLPPVQEVPVPKQIWQIKDTVATVPDRPVRDAAATETTLFATNTGGTELVAIDVQSGETRWRAPIRFPQPRRLAVAGKHLLLIGRKNLVAFRISDGSQEWSGDLGCMLLRIAAHAERAVGYCASETETRDHLIQHNNSAIALDLSSGRVLWRYNAHESDGRDALGFFMDIDDRYAYVERKNRPHGGRYDSTLRALDLHTGRESWHATVANAVFRPTVVSDLVVAVGDGLDAFRAKDGASAWSSPAPQRVHGDEGSGFLWSRLDMPIMGGKIARVRSGNLEVVDLASGKELFKSSLPRPPAGKDQTAKVRLALANSDGHQLVADIESFPSDVPGYLVVWRNGHEQIFQAPSTSLDLVLVAGDVLITQTRVATGWGLTAYSLRTSDKIEEASLPPRSKVEAALRRMGRLDDTYVDENAIDALKKIPDAAVYLRQLATDSSSPLRNQAIFSFLYIHTPEAVPALLKMVDEPVGNPESSPRRFAILALTEYPNPEVVARFARLLTEPNLDPPGDDWLPTPRELEPAVYRFLARAGGSAAEDAFRKHDTNRRRPGGWRNLCQTNKPEKIEVNKTPVDVPPVTGACGGDTAFGALRFGRYRSAWWVRRNQGTHWSEPAFLVSAEQTAFESAQVSARSIVLQGLKTSNGARWTKSFDSRQVFADRDGDGIPDTAEDYLGTDAGALDTDGDGIPDGLDPSPLAGPARSEEARVQVEIVRYFALCEPNQRVIIVTAPAATFGQVADAAPLVLHRDLTTHPTGPQIWDKRTLPVLIETIELGGETVTARVRLGEDEESEPRQENCTRELKLRRVGGIWRVSEDRRVPVGCFETRPG